MTVLKSKGTTVRLKIVVLFLFLAGLVFVQPKPAWLSGQVPKPVTHGVTPEVPASLPPDILIDDFDKTIQERFLKVPFFGARRIAPPEPMSPENPHFESFRPYSPAEVAAVEAFTRNSWDVGIYLYGRRVRRRTDTKREKYDISYRLFNPIPVAGKLKKSDFPDPKDLTPEIKQAFVEFTRRGGASENEMRLDRGRWSYVARPVRAVNQSCVECHTDYVITERLGDGKFTARERRIGDPNGVLVYAFKRSNE